MKAMAAKAIGLPEIPPSGPWDSYVLVIIWLPLILRIIFLIVPFRKAIAKLAPHTGWALKQLKSLPVRGFGLLALNEILAFMIPPLLVLLLFHRIVKHLYLLVLFYKNHHLLKD